MTTSKSPPSPAVIRHVLFATDLSVASSRARHHAVDLAERSSAKLTILHVLEPIGYPYLIPQLEGVRRDATARVDTLVREARLRVKEVSGVVLDGAPALEITDAARQLGADLLVVGTHGRSGVGHALLGSVAEKIVRTSAVPVLTVTSWRFLDLRHAASCLAERIEVPAGAILVGLGRVGAMLAAHLSEITGAPADAFLVAPLTIENEAIAGFVGENGGQRIHGWAADVSEWVLQCARENLAVEAKILRRACPPLDVRGQPVILVCARADEDLALMVAVDALRQAGASRLTAAFAVAAPLTVERTRDAFDGVVVIDTVDSGAERDLAYRQGGAPSIGAVRRHLARSREDAATSGSRPPVKLANRTVRVRAVPGGFAVFGRAAEQLSEPFVSREDAVAEAEEDAGEGGLVLVEDAFGHIEREVHATHPRAAAM